MKLGPENIPLPDVRLRDAKCCIRLSSGRGSDRRNVKWRISTYFLESLLHSIQDEYTRLSFLAVLRRVYNIPDDRVGLSLHGMDFLNY